MTIVQEWLTASIFTLGVFIMLIGIVLVVAPDVVKNISRRLDHWVSTEAFFQAFDKPRYVERSFYHHHRIFGVLIIAGALYVLYALTLTVDVDATIARLPVLKNPMFSEWIYSSLWYALVGLNAVIVVIGVLIVFRPSLLKAMEMVTNHWVTSERPLERLNQRHAIPEDVFPRNIRLFGVAVTLAGVYIMLATCAVLL